MLELNVVNKLPDNKVLISEKNVKVPNSPVRYYIAGEDNADKFVKKRESLNTIDGWQKYMSMTVSAVTGILFLTKVKSNALIKGLVGLTSGYGTYLGLRKLDDMVDVQAQKSNLKYFKAEEITGNQEKIDEAINYKPESEIEPDKTEEVDTKSELEPEKEVEVEKEPEDKPEEKPESDDKD